MSELADPPSGTPDIAKGEHKPALRCEFDIMAAKSRKAKPASGKISDVESFGSFTNLMVSRPTLSDVVSGAPQLNAAANSIQVLPADSRFWVVQALCSRARVAP